MRLVFNASYCIPIHAEVLQERPLGGTETGIVRVAENLARLGHEVFVVTSHSQPPPAPAGAPIYLPVASLPLIKECDVLIAVQDWRTAIVPLRTGRRVFWTGDGPDQFINYGLGDRRVTQLFDSLFTVSNWQTLALTGESGFPMGKTAVVRNGVHLPWFEGSEPRNPKRLIFASSPYRGLELVPRILPAIQKIDPSIELHVFSALAVYDRDKPFSGPEQNHYLALKAELERLPNCFMHGNVPQQKLAREYMRSALLFYPNIFRETSCIVALEAMAAGCPVVTSRYGALPETVGGAGVTIPGNPSSAEYAEHFAQVTLKILEDPTIWGDLSRRAYGRARSLYSWEIVSARFNDALQRLT